MTGSEVTAAGWEVFEIIWINILLSGDNAILIALACRQLAVKQRRWGVFLGALGGVVLRVLFTLGLLECFEVRRHTHDSPGSPDIKAHFLEEVDLRLV